MADRSVSVPMTLSDLERLDANGHIFQADLILTNLHLELYNSLVIIFHSLLRQRQHRT